MVRLNQYHRNRDACSIFFRVDFIHHDFKGFRWLTCCFDVFIAVSQVRIWSWMMRESWEDSRTPSRFSPMSTLPCLARTNSTLQGPWLIKTIIKLTFCCISNLITMLWTVILIFNEYGLYFLRTLFLYPQPLCSSI